MIDFCGRQPLLANVIKSITDSMESVVSTAVLGFCIQYVFVAVGFMLFAQGYGFADMATGGCATLWDCLKGHFDYGFRSAPVWDGPELTWTRFGFDYLYNLFVILIMAAIISGIIIDCFAELKDAQQEMREHMETVCFICSMTKSDLQRQGVVFESHILHHHYMWAYARFLLYLDESEDSELNGPESYVKSQIKGNNMAFFPINRSIELEAKDVGDKSGEREVRVKDMDDFKTSLRYLRDSSEGIKRDEQQFKAELKELREHVVGSTLRIQQMQQSMSQDDDQDKKKKKKKGA